MKYLVLFIAVLLFYFHASAVICSKPGNLRVSHKAPNTMTIQWDTVSGSLGYQFYIKQHPSSSNSGTTTSANYVLASGLQPGIQYDICVRTICPTDTSEWTCITETNPMPCNPPSKLYFTSVTDEEIVFHWDTLSNSTGYRFYVVGDTTQATPASIYTTSSKILAEYLEPGTKYRICVKTLCDQDSSIWYCDVITTLPNGINTVINDSHLIKAYPNPVNSRLTVELPESGNNGHLLLSDVLGTVIYYRTVNSAKEIIDMSTLQTGMYFIRYASDNYSAVIKVQKE